MNSSAAAALQADVDALRPRFPRTADLYRETCALMFFRHGVTPTANALYQLVRKGSMSTPTAALRAFWDDLREKARVDVSHAGIPDEVKAAAGELIAQIWSLARAQSDAVAEALTATIQGELDDALRLRAESDRRAQELAAQVNALDEQLAAAKSNVVSLRAELASVTALLDSSKTQAAQAHREIEGLQREIGSLHEVQAAELETVTARVEQAEQRYVDLEKRILVDLDRERTAAAQRQKQLEKEVRSASGKSEELRNQMQQAIRDQVKQDQEVVKLKVQVDLLSGERDRALVLATEAAEAKTAAVSLLSAERARVEELREQLRQRKPATRNPGGKKSLKSRAISPREDDKP